jgi:hypothetical protein
MEEEDQSSKGASSSSHAKLIPQLHQWLAAHGSTEITLASYFLSMYQNTQVNFDILLRPFTGSTVSLDKNGDEKIRSVLYLLMPLPMTTSRLMFTPNRDKLLGSVHLCWLAEQFCRSTQKHGSCEIASWHLL